MSVDTGAPESPLDGVPKPGETIAGKYEVVRVLGVGGMGAVVAANHLHLGQQVAIKFLTAQSARDPKRVERFSREAWAAARIKSDHIVRVSDVGTLADGTPYMVMEYLEGEDLEVVVQRGRMPIERAVGYVLQAAEALAEAHKNGIVHRDLKPGNLYVTQRADGSDWVKVLDFGISKMIGGGRSLTQTSALLGSPLYMAPEQLASSKYVDHRADIWALGVLLFELVAGTPPFVADTLPQVCLKILQGEPLRLGELLPGVPPGFEAALYQSLVKNPDERYGDLSAFAQAVAPFGDEGARLSAAYIGKVLIGFEATAADPRSASSSSMGVAAGPGGPGTTGDEITSSLVPSSDDELSTAVQTPPELIEAVLAEQQAALGAPSSAQVVAAEPAAGVPQTLAQAPGAAPAVTAGMAGQHTEAMVGLPAGAAALGAAGAVTSTLQSVQHVGVQPAGGPVPRVGVVTADAVSHSLTPAPKSKAPVIATLIAVFGLLLAGAVGIVVLFSGGDGQTPSAAGETAAESSSDPAPATTAEPGTTLSEATTAAPADDGAGGTAEPAATVSSDSASSEPTAKPVRTYVPRRPPKGPGKKWTPFDDR